MLIMSPQSGYGLNPIITIGSGATTGISGFLNKPYVQYAVVLSALYLGYRKFIKKESINFFK